MPIMVSVTLRRVPELFDEVNKEVMASGHPATGLVAVFEHPVGDVTSGWSKYGCPRLTTTFSTKWSTHLQP